MKNLIVPVLAFLLLLAGGSVGFMKWMHLGPFAVEPEEGEEAPAQPRKREQPRYVDMDPVNVGLIVGDRPRGVLQISAKLEVANDKDAAEVRKKMSRLTSALITDLHDFLPRVLRDVEHIELDLLSERIQYVADKTYGRGIVRQVLIQSVHDSGGKS